MISMLCVCMIGILCVYSWTKRSDDGTQHVTQNKDVAKRQKRYYFKILNWKSYLNPCVMNYLAQCSVQGGLEY